MINSKPRYGTAAWRAKRERQERRATTEGSTTPLDQFLVNGSVEHGDLDRNSHLFGRELDQPQNEHPETYSAIAAGYLA